MKVFFRHEKIREGQEELVKDISECLSTKKHLVAHAPTGLGKTDAAISAAFSYAIENQKTVFFLTPKISQHKLAVEVVKGISKKHNLDIMGADLIGKKHMCIHKEILDADSENFYDLCSKMRKYETCPFYGYAKGYNLKQKAVAEHNFSKVLEWYDKIEKHDDVKAFCESLGHVLMPTMPCAYEISIRLAEKSNFIIGDYYHLLNESISDQILKKTNKNLQDSIIIIDEAHNAPSRIRAALTSTLDTYTLRSAQKEAKILDQHNLSKFLHEIETQVTSLGNKMKKEEQPVFFDSIPEIDLKLALDIYEMGIEFLGKGKKNTSSLIKIAKFYKSWNGESQAYLRYMKKWKTGSGYSVIHRCLDPSVYTSELLDGTHSAILMSGTLKPQPMYRDLLGLESERTVLKEYNSPFPKQNKISVIDDSVTTKYTERNEDTYEKIVSQCVNLTNNVPGNCAVFFPSYAVLENCADKIEKNSEKPIIKQTPEASVQETKSKLKRFRMHAEEKGAVLLAVTGGSFAEGIDLPGKELLCVIVVGIPFAEPSLETQALIKYYDFKFNRGWEYGYDFPAMTKAVQAAGRCIRSETDKGVVVFMDNRYRQKKYLSCIPSEYDILVNQHPESLLTGFFE